jgi:hypothetical protein
LAVATGKTLTISRLEAGSYKIFTLTGTGAVAFTPGAVPATNPVWFGAVGDGATDNTAALQASLNATPSGGKWALPLASSWYPTDKLLIPPQIHLTGLGGGETVLPWLRAKDSSVTSIFYNAEEFHGSISNLRIDIAEGTNTAAAVDFVAGSSRAVIERNYLTPSSLKSQYGLKFTSNPNSSHHNTIRRNFIDGGRYSVYFGSTGSSYQSNLNRIQENTLGGQSGYTGVYLAFAQGNEISGNNFLDSGSSSKRVHIYGTGTETATNLIAGNYFDGAAAADTVYFDTPDTNVAPAAFCFQNASLDYTKVTDANKAARKVVMDASPNELIHALASWTYLMQYRVTSNPATSSYYPNFRGDDSAKAVSITAGEWNDGAGMVLMGKDFTTHSAFDVGTVNSVVRDVAGAGHFVFKTSDGTNFIKMGGIDKDGALRVGNSATGDVTGTAKLKKIQVFAPNGDSLGYVQTYAGP